MAKTQKKDSPSRMFHFGVLAAMAVVAGMDEETVWREIVRSNGGYDYLRGLSKRAGNLRMDGFTRYRRDAEAGSR